MSNDTRNFAFTVEAASLHLAGLALLASAYSDIGDVKLYDATVATIDDFKNQIIAIGEAEEAALQDENCDCDFCQHVEEALSQAAENEQANILPEKEEETSGCGGSPDVSFQVEYFDVDEPVCECPLCVTGRSLFGTSK